MRATPILVAGFFSVACGGAPPPAEAPEPAADPAGDGPRPGHGVETDVSMPETEEVEKVEVEDPDPAPAAAADPEFTDTMTVDQAIKAVPQGGERLNVDQEALGAPLQDPAVFKACGGGAFKVKIAVWNGRAVGVDVITKNKKLATCVNGVVRGLEWKDKVKSLNTVEFAY